MKIKSDLVTNSSSTAYVVFIPENFEITDEEIKNVIIESYEEDFDPNDFESVKKSLLNELKDLKNGHDVFYDEWDKYNMFEPLSRIFEDKNLVIAVIDVPSESGSIVGVTSSKISEILLDNIETKNLLNIKKEKE